MNIDLLSIIDNEGSEIAFNGEVVTKDYNLTVNSRVSGKVTNSSGRLEVKADVVSSVETVCSRCIAPLATDLQFIINEVVGEDEVTLNGTVLDVGELVERNLFMNLPMKFLCSEDCRGLCAKCGADLNKEDCKCNDDEIDERFSALKKLLE